NKVCEYIETEFWKMFDFFAIVILIEYSTLLNKISGGVFFRYGERPRSLNALLLFVRFLVLLVFFVFFIPLRPDKEKAPYEVSTSSRSSQNSKSTHCWTFSAVQL
ncbi:unnamed protein product, partial [Pocillopora meandrina]